MSHVRFPEIRHVTGIDISELQLSRNAQLDERILGDLQSFPLPSNSFDCTICWDVLEHLRFPERAMDNLVRATKAGGLIVFAVPNRNSIKGLMTRFTPHLLHVWIYRYIFKENEAGTADSGPFPTYLRPGISPKRLGKFAIRHNLEQVIFIIYTSRVVATGRRHAPMLFSCYSLLVRGLKALSFQRYEGGLTDVLLVWRKR
jgi:SAM-dependent methyltransferase